MSEESHEYIAVKLDGERRKEIDLIKQRFEDWARSQTELNIELKHEMQLVVKGQEALKERFERGTANTLKELKDSFDAFRIEWGEKKSEDRNRDSLIKAATDSASKANEKYDGINRGIMWVVIVGAILTVAKLIINWRP